MALIYTPYRVSVMVLLVASMSERNVDAFVPMRQPTFGSRAIVSGRSSALSMVGSEDYLKKLSPFSYQEYYDYGEAEAWMPEIPTPDVQEELMMQVGEETVMTEENVVADTDDSFVQAGIEEAAASVAEMQAEITTGEEIFVAEPEEMVMEELEQESVIMEETAVVSEPPKTDTIPRAYAIVPINESTIEFTSGMVGGVTGFALAGPVGGIFGATICNFLSRQVEGDLTEAISNTAKKSIDLYNYMAKLNNKYEILARSKKSLTSSIDKIKSSDSISPEARETMAKMEQKLTEVGKKIDDINHEYDLSNNFLLALDKFGDVVERTVKKSVEFEKKNNVSGKLMQAWSQAIEKALEAAEETRRK